MQLLDIPAAIPDRVEHLLRPIMKSTPGQAVGCRSGEWDRFESQLVQWEQHPDELEDEGLDPPNPETIPLIREVCRALRTLAVEPPLRLVPNCEGGAVFEWRSAPFLWSVEVERDGSLELSAYATTSHATARPFCRPALDSDIIWGALRTNPPTFTANRK